MRTTRNTWRHRLRRQWHNVRPVVLLGLGFSALVLGTIGYLQLKVPGQPRYDFFDSFYRSMTLFVFGGAATPPIPWTLQVARILAPVLTGYAAIGAVLALTRDQARVLAIRMLIRHHVVIAGLGETGSRLATALVDHEPVVVIESDLSNEHLAAARLRGVRALVGDAKDDVLLRRAGLRHARALVISCGNDGTNVDVAAAATRGLQERRRALTIFVHLRDLDLWSSLAAEGATFGLQRPGVRLEYFNVLATGAQLLLERHPPFPSSPPGSEPRRAHVLVVGLDGVGEQLLLQIARLWSQSELGPGDELRITLAGPDAHRDLAGLLSRYPALARYATVRAREFELESARFQAGEAMLGDDGACEVTHAYVSIQDERDALLAALALHARSDTTHVPVTVAVTDAESGIAILVDSDHGRFRYIEAFGVITAATSVELLLRGTNELIARAQHAQWRRRELAKGTSPDRNPNLKPWEQLDDRQREENRRFADDLHTKLSLVGCMLVPKPLPDPNEPPFSFSHDDLEMLSQHEHVRWMETKLAQGWHYGEVRDDALKVHDQIKPWEHLDEDNRDKDRDAVREIPEMLAGAGFRIQKTAG